MKKIITLAIVLLVIGVGIAQAETFRAELNASQTSIFTGLDTKRYVTNGYMKYGANGIFADTENKKYSLFSAKLMVGSETFFENLSCEVGIKGVLGTAEERNDDGSVGAVAFSGIASYRLPQGITPIPIQFSLEMSGSPSILSFLDAKNYFDVKTSVAIYIVENAALQLSYHFYNIDMKENNFKDDRLLLGLVLEF
jgi:hypothetical protein